jgi:prevent-host-death family protein
MSGKSISKILKIKPQVVMRNGRPDAVIIDIKDYQKLLERLEDKEDLADLIKMRKGSLRFRKFDEFLAEHNNAL